jgi:hypothetical protein
MNVPWRRRTAPFESFNDRETSLGVLTGDQHFQLVAGGECEHRLPPFRRMCPRIELRLGLLFRSVS